MYKGKNVACVIPARLASTRFPEKVLKSLAGKPLLQWVYEAAKETEIFDQIYIAVDAEKTSLLAKSFGGKTLMTNPECLTGTDRIIEAKERYALKADVWVNWQADEPFINKQIIQDLLQSIDKEGDVWTLRKEISKQEEKEDHSVVKVVTGDQDRALYFSRYCIPFRQKELNMPIYKHIGIYAFSDKALLQIGKLKSCLLEQTESLEQLRFLYYGLVIKAHETRHETLGIDFKEHLELAEKLLSAKALC